MKMTINGYYTIDYMMPQGKLIIKRGDMDCNKKVTLNIKQSRRRVSVDPNRFDTFTIPINSTRQLNNIDLAYGLAMMHTPLPSVETTLDISLFYGEVSSGSLEDFNIGICSLDENNEIIDVIGVDFWRGNQKDKRDFFYIRPVWNSIDEVWISSTNIPGLNIETFTYDEFVAVAKEFAEDCVKASYNDMDMTDACLNSKCVIQFPPSSQNLGTASKFPPFNIEKV